MPKILFVEDNDDLRNATIDYLSFEGYQVIGANSGSMGIDLTLKHKPDIIICDILMKDMDGYEVRKKLKSHSETSLIPFIFLTALSEKENIRKGMDLGADDYLIKPVSLEILKNAINSRCEKSKEYQHYIDARITEFKKEIIRVLPHEFLTPLNVVLGFANLIKQEAQTLTTKEIKEMASYIEEGGDRLKDLINRYLYYIYQVSYSQQKTKNVSCCTKDVMSIISSNTSSKFNREDDLICEIEEAEIQIESKDLEYIVKEIVDNAFKFSKKGTNVIVYGRIVDSNYELRVIDSGIGFPFSDEDIVSELGAFNQFNREILEQQGTGLGLITSLLIIQRNNGQISIKNQKEGVLVSVILPVAK
ncbi:MAG: response regulator [Bacteroidales bacterium]